jgi:hypothetical protein
MPYLFQKAKTQKARGILALAESPSILGNSSIHTQGGVCLIPQTEHWHMGLGRTRFARPCPVRPRHGFVESRKVTCDRDVLDVFLEARQADPEAEVILMDMLRGQFSAVATPQGITFGKEHDGVTAGKGKNFTIPINGADHFLSPTWRDHLGIKHTEYVELVSHHSEVTAKTDDMIYAVQVRDGPKQQTGITNFIPKDMVVKHRLKPTQLEVNDMLTWERKIDMVKDLDGLVVVLDPKVALSSHLAVHAIQHNIPILRDGSKAYRGQKLSQEVSHTEEYTEENHLRFLEALNEAKHFTKTKDFLGAGIGTIHAQALWGYSTPLLRLRATALVSVIRGIFEACLGEDRHYRSYFVDTAVPWRQLGSENDDEPQHSRSSCFHALRKKTWEELEPIVKGVQQDLERDEWYRTEEVRVKYRYDEDGKVIGRAKHQPEAKSECGYGGRKWASANEKALELYNLINNASKVDTKSAHAREKFLNKLFDKSNVLLNEVHNGQGRIIGKVFEGDNISMFMSKAATNPTMTFANPLVAQMVLKQETF